MYGYLFVHITLHGFFSEFSVVRGGGNDETVSTGCGSPSVLHPWMLLLHMQETALWIPPVCCVLDDICKRQLLWIPRGAFCPLEGGPRHIGTDTLAPVLHVCVCVCVYCLCVHIKKAKTITTFCTILIKKKKKKKKKLTYT